MITASREEAILRTSLGACPLLPISRSHYLLIPKAWVEIYGLKRGGKIWVEVRNEPAKIIISAIDPMEAHQLLGEEEPPSGEKDEQQAPE